VFAIIWALNHFKHIIYGSHITVFSDHNPLMYMRDCAPKRAGLLIGELKIRYFIDATMNGSNDAM